MRFISSFYIYTQRTLVSHEYSLQILSIDMFNFTMYSTLNNNSIQHIIPDVIPNTHAVESLTAGASTPQNADPTAAPAEVRCVIYSSRPFDFSML